MKPDEAEGLDRQQVRERAAAGVGLMTFQGAVVRILAFLGNIALARILLPEDFGLFTFGLTLIFLTNAVSDAGIAAALIRRKEAPEREDLRALLALQLMVISPVVFVTFAAGSFFGEPGLLVAVMVLALPVDVFRMPGTIVLERQLAYSRLVVVELGHSIVFYGWTISTAAALGLGAWSFATGMVLRSLVGTVLMAGLAPVGLIFPRPSWRRIRGSLRFGLQFQLAGIVLLGREQVVNIVTSAVAGLATLGLWGLATRILTVPFELFRALMRVSFPAMSRLLATGEDPGPLLERAFARAAVGTGFLLTGLVGSAPAAVPLIFGSEWERTADILPWASLGLMVSGPIGVAATGYLYAVGDASTPLVSAVLAAVAFWLIAFPLLPFLDSTALGLGWMGAAVAEAFVLGRRVSERTSARVARPLARPVLAAVVAAAAGWATASALGANALSAVASAAIAEGLFAALLFTVDRRPLMETLSFARYAFRAAWPRARWV